LPDSKIFEAYSAAIDQQSFFLRGELSLVKGLIEQPDCNCALLTCLGKQGGARNICSIGTRCRDDLQLATETAGNKNAYAGSREPMKKRISHEWNQAKSSGNFRGKFSPARLWWLKIAPGLLRVDSPRVPGDSTKWSAQAGAGYSQLSSSPERSAAKLVGAWPCE
jgi:hypothetical protein